MNVMIANNCLDMTNDFLEVDEEALIDGSCLIKSCTLATSDLSSCIIPRGLSFINSSFLLDGISPYGFPSFPVL